MNPGRHKILVGDSLEMLKKLPNEMFHCAVTSPPYWGLRAYGTDEQVWGGDKNCIHDWSKVPPRRRRKAVGITDPDSKQATNKGTMHDLRETNFCRKCKAWRGELGLEPTPKLYVEHMVEVCREVKRVLRKDGIFWIVIGDSYASGKGTCLNPGGGDSSLGKGRKKAGAHPLDRGSESDLRKSGLKPKDLVMIPARLALALQEDGWWVRSRIIWDKSNPMPSSVTDRPSMSHEDIFMLTKSKKYYYDHVAVQEPAVGGTKGAASSFRRKDSKRGKEGICPNSPTATHREDREDVRYDGETRNRRTVWHVATRPYKEAHFATYPPKLIEPCILAGTSEKGCCPKCRAPWKRVIKKKLTAHDGDTASAYKKGSTANRLALLRQAARERGEEYTNETETIRWDPTCKCELLIEKNKPCLVLDPFAGASTTGVVATAYGRDYVGVELNREYAEMGNKRMNNEQANDYPTVFGKKKVKRRKKDEEAKR